MVYKVLNVNVIVSSDVTVKNMTIITSIITITTTIVIIQWKRKHKNKIMSKIWQTTIQKTDSWPTKLFAIYVTINSWKVIWQTATLFTITIACAIKQMHDKWCNNAKLCRVRKMFTRRLSTFNSVPTQNVKLTNDFLHKVNNQRLITQAVRDANVTVKRFH